MAKLTLTNITAGYGSNTAFNANFAAIVTALENTLSRDGTIPNTMNASFDMNSNRIINLAAPVNSNDGARLTDIQAALAGGSANLITNVPAGTISATNVQAALNELDIEKALLAGSSSQTFSVATAIAAAHAVRADQLSADLTNFPTYTTGTVAGMTATGSAGTFAVNDPQYVKIGRMVMMTGQIICSAGGTTGALTINGMPFTAAHRSTGVGKEDAVTGEVWALDIPAGGTSAYLGVYNNGSRTWTTSWVVTFSITYFV